MPTYEYRCKSCSNELEAQQSFSDDPLTVCPACNEPALKKVYGNIAVTFKGSGFYKTDNRPSGGKSSTSESKSESSSSSSSESSSSSSESKSEKKSESAPAASTTSSSSSTT